MNIQEAVDLIAPSKVLPGAKPSVWADLGCGSGTFTQALARLLPPHSEIYAIDQSPQAIPSTDSVTIHFRQADFEEQLQLPAIDGILMANALHYVRHKAPFLQNLKMHFRGVGQFIIVEYDHRNANPWVPYPLDLEQAKELFSSLGYENIIKLGERQSIYGRGNMYAIRVYQ